MNQPCVGERAVLEKKTVDELLKLLEERGGDWARQHKGRRPKGGAGVKDQRERAAAQKERERQKKEEQRRKKDDEQRTRDAPGPSRPARPDRKVDEDQLLS